MATIKAKINPKLLQWARENLGYTVQEVAPKINVKDEQLIMWESGEDMPTIKQMRKIAHSVYKRPLAFFYLKTIPEEHPLPIDFRVHPKSGRSQFSPIARFQIRLARTRREDAIDLAKATNIDINTTIGNASLNDSPENLVKHARKLMSVRLEDQLACRNPVEALKLYISAIERLGVLVSQAQRVDYEEFRGFSIAERPFPAIVINSKDTQNGKFFTLFHEYAHLLLNRSGICDLASEENDREENSIVEIFCNRFAGEFLVPKDAFLHAVPRPAPPLDQWDDVEILKLARKFKVSQEVIVRRLLTFDLTTRLFYQQKKTQYDSEYKEHLKKRKEDKDSGGPPYHVQVISANGNAYTSLVLSAYHEEKINLNDVSGYLNVRVEHIPKIESEIL